jgi:trimethylamine---corrinoid protein Co-methyltransferase
MNLKMDFTVRPKMQVLSQAEIDFFYGSALEVLERIGVRVLHPQALELMKKAGAAADADALVKIRSSLVEKAIRSAPKKVFIYDREGNPAMELGGGNTGGINTYYGTGSDLKNTYDPYTRELRPTVSRDIANMAVVADFLPNMDFLMSYGIPSDAPFDRLYRTEFLEMVRNSTKPIVFTSDNGDDTRRIIEMAALVSGGMDNLRMKPFVINYSQPTSPLQHSADALGKVFACAEAGIPVAYPPGMIPGATAPTTTAGVITQSIAESLSALVIHQLKKEGAPIILCGAHGCFDMKSAINVYAAPGRLTTQAALAAFYQHFGFPTWGFGGCTDAQILDQQAGMEFAMLNLWAGLCGVNLAHDTGYVGSGMIGCLSSLVLNDEMIDYVRHVLCRGVIVNEDTRALAVLERVGPGGNFLTDPHTFGHFKKEFWRPFLLNTDRHEAWMNKGAKKAGDKADEKAREILKNHAPKPLPQKILDGLEELRSA